MQYFDRKPGPIIHYDAQMERLERANPDTFRVEHRAQFAATLNAYLPQAQVDAIFDLGWPNSIPLHQREHGVLPGEDYYAHGDPSDVGANFGFAIAHLAHGEVNGEQMNHVIFDVLHAWVPGDFDYNDYQIDYTAVEDDLKRFIDRFMPVSLTFDQFNSTGTIQRLHRYVASRNYPKAIGIRKRHATKALNWETYETFKAAVGMNLVRAPNFRLARDELTYLQNVEGKIKPPTTGPVITKDVADCMAILTHDLIGEQVAAMLGQRLAGVRLRGSASGGINPYPPAPKMNPLEQLSSFGERNSAPEYWGFPGRRAVNPDGTFVRGRRRRQGRGLPRHRN